MRSAFKQKKLYFYLMQLSEQNLKQLYFLLQAGLIAALIEKRTKNRIFLLVLFKYTFNLSSSIAEFSNIKKTKSLSKNSKIRKALNLNFIIEQRNYKKKALNSLIHCRFR